MSQMKCQWVDAGDMARDKRIFLLLGVCGTMWSVSIDNGIFGVSI